MTALRAAVECTSRDALNAARLVDMGLLPVSAYREAMDKARAARDALVEATLPVRDEDDADA